MRSALPWLVATSLLLWPAQVMASQLVVQCRDGAANECLTVSAPLDPTGVIAGEVALHAERLGAVERRKSAVLFVPGGPGQAGSPFLRDIAEEFKSVLDSRDIVVFDPRGTGSSSGYRCPELPESASALGHAIEKCEQGLAGTASLFTTAEQVSDIDHIRAELGIEKLVLYGTSYGTRAAMAYAAAHPANVEAVVLDSPVVPDGLDAFRRQVLVALPRVVREACFGSCDIASDDPGRDLVRLAGQLARRPLTGWMTSPTGTRKPARIDVNELVQLAATADSNPTVDAELPSVVWSALHRDPQPLFRLAARIFDEPPGASGPFGSSTAAYLAAVCTETGMPWDVASGLSARRASLAAAIATAPLGTLGGFPRGVLLPSPYVQTCQYWRGPRRIPQVGRIASPTLVLSGTVDARTPREVALEVASSVAGARILFVPGAHHGVLASDVTGCARRAVHDFLAARAPVRCTRRSPRYKTFPVVPVRVGSNSRAGSAAAATLSAVSATLDDMARHLWLAPSSGDGDFRVAIGGLRGGTAAVANRRTRLHRLEVVPGVRITGVLDAREPMSRLRVSGSSAAQGIVDVSRSGKLVGRLAGNRVVGQTHAYGHNPLPVIP